MTAVPPLRRKLLRSPKTVALYTGLVEKFHRQHGLTRSSNMVEIDRALDLELNRFFVMGKHVSQGLHLFYAVRWYHNLLTPELRLSTLSRKGFQKTCPVKAPVPLTWEEILLMSYALCCDSDSSYTPRQRASASLAFLTAFDCYGRGGDICAAEESELRPPIGKQHGAASAWTLNLFPTTMSSVSKMGGSDETMTVGKVNPVLACCQPGAR